MAADKRKYMLVIGMLMLFLIAPMALLWPTVFGPALNAKGESLAMRDTEDVIIMLGDSLTDWTEWDDLPTDSPVENHGVAGEPTGGVLLRLPPILEREPKAIFLMIGTNDLFMYEDLETSFENYTAIVEAVRTTSPGTKLYLQSVLPTVAPMKARVVAFNEHIRALATEHGARYLDLFPLYLDEDGSIKNEYSYDEVHLTPAGYAVWKAELAPTVNALNRGLGK